MEVCNLRGNSVIRILEFIENSQRVKPRAAQDPVQTR